MDRCLQTLTHRARRFPLSVCARNFSQHYLSQNDSIVWPRDNRVRTACSRSFDACAPHFFLTHLGIHRLFFDQVSRAVRACRLHLSHVQENPTMGFPTDLSWQWFLVFPLVLFRMYFIKLSVFTERWPRLLQQQGDLCRGCSVTLVRCLAVCQLLISLGKTLQCRGFHWAGSWVPCFEKGVLAIEVDAADGEITLRCAVETERGSIWIWRAAQYMCAWKSIRCGMVSDVSLRMHRNLVGLRISKSQDQLLDNLFKFYFSDLTWSLRI